jgi:hypothetical protein
MARAIALTVEAEGVSRVISEIAKDQKERMPKFLARVGTFLRAEFVKSMQSGVDPTGKKLPQPAVWTRIAGVGRGKKSALSAASGGSLIPLLNTGRMQAGLGTVRVTDKILVFGFRGSEKRKATSQMYGIPGKMRVRQGDVSYKAKEKVGEVLVGKGKWNYQKTRKDVIKKVKKSIYSGILEGKNGKYIRVLNGSKGWITKRVDGSNMVDVNPVARRFFYLSPQQQDKIVNMFVDQKAV